MRNESCSGRGVRKSYSPVRIMVGTVIADSFDVSGSKSRKDLHQILQRIDVVDQPSAVPGEIDQVSFLLRATRPRNSSGTASPEESVVPPRTSAVRSAAPNRNSCGGNSAKLLIGTSPATVLPMLDDVAQRDHAAEADPGEENRPRRPSSAMSSPSTATWSACSMNRRRLVGLPLPEHVEAGDAKPPRDQRDPKGYPKLDILGQTIDQHKDRAVRPDQPVRSESDASCTKARASGSLELLCRPADYPDLGRLGHRPHLYGAGGLQRSRQTPPFACAGRGRAADRAWRQDCRSYARHRRCRG